MAMMIFIKRKTAPLNFENPIPPTLERHLGRQQNRTGQWRGREQSVACEMFPKHRRRTASLDPAAIWQLCAANKTTLNKASRTNCNLHTRATHIPVPIQGHGNSHFRRSVDEIMVNIDQEISINYLPPPVQHARPGDAPPPRLPAAAAGFCTVTNYSCLPPLKHIAGASDFRFQN